MKKVIDRKYQKFELEIDGIIAAFDKSGEGIKDARNTLKLFALNNVVINIKSFKTPNFINQIVYKFFRNGKAKRSFEYAKKLQKLSIKTPQPIAYYEFTTSLFFKKKFLCKRTTKT